MQDMYVLLKEHNSSHTITLLCIVVHEQSCSEDEDLAMSHQSSQKYIRTKVMINTLGWWLPITMTSKN